MEELMREALTVALIVSLVPMLAISFGAGIVTLLQSITQVQEQSLTHLARLAVFALIIIICGEHGYALIEKVFFRAFSLLTESDWR